MKLRMEDKKVGKGAVVIAGIVFLIWLFGASDKRERLIAECVAKYGEGSEACRLLEESYGHALDVSAAETSGGG